MKESDYMENEDKALELLLSLLKLERERFYLADTEFTRRRNDIMNMLYKSALLIK